jgi:hypothetical protein
MSWFSVSTASYFGGPVSNLYLENDEDGFLWFPQSLEANASKVRSLLLSYTLFLMY